MDTANINITQQEFNDFKKELFDRMENMATKKDLETMATKKDLETMATKKDLETMATKKDLKAMGIKLKAVRADINNISDDLSQLQRQVDATESAPVPYGRPQAFHSEARVHSVSGSRLTRTGRF